MLFLVKEGTNIIVAKNINDESFQSENLKKTQAKSDMVFPEKLIMMDPFGLKKETMSQLTATNDDISKLLSEGYYGFKNNNTEHIFLIKCYDIKIF